jgi:hypothetical protein
MNGSAGIIQRGYGSSTSHLPHYGYGWHGHKFTLPHAPYNPGSHPGGRFPVGMFNVFVTYTAGYSSTPADLEQACNKLAANLIRGGSHDGNLSSMSGPDFSESFAGNGAFTPEIVKDLARFRGFPLPETADF